MSELKNLIVSAIDLSKSSGVPLLLLGNPGIAKTTNVKYWAEKNNYNITTLIGSQRTPDEVLGYMVNTGKELSTFTPDWYNEIIRSEKPSILFIDELSQAPELTQGALLQLIFERKVGGNNKLPDDTLIISAANYKGNIPDYCTIQTAALNRFLIINLSYDSTDSLLDEFLSVNTENRPIYTQRTLTNEQVSELKSLFKAAMIDIFDAEKEDIGEFNINNTEINNLFNPEFGTEVYNIVTGRTIHYLEKCVKSLIELGFYIDKNIVDKVVMGLIGAGSGNFKSEYSLKWWIEYTCRTIGECLSKAASYFFYQESFEEIGVTEDLTIPETINKFMNDRSSLPSTELRDTFDENQLGKIYNKVKVLLPETPFVQLNQISNKEYNIFEVTDDIDAITSLSNFIKAEYKNKKSVPRDLLLLNRIAMYYRNYSNQEEQSQSQNNYPYLAKKVDGTIIRITQERIFNMLMEYHLDKDPSEIKSAEILEVYVFVNNKIKTMSIEEFSNYLSEKNAEQSSDRLDSLVKNLASFLP